jgi:hypothetical protein
LRFVLVKSLEETAERTTDPELRELDQLDKNLAPTRRKVANEILLWMNKPTMVIGVMH